jgi:hypothetical protein
MIGRLLGPPIQADTTEHSRLTQPAAECHWTPFRAKYVPKSAASR